MAGWIKLYRQLLDSPVFSNEKYLKVWVYILLRANHSPNSIIRAGKTITIETGSFLTGRKRLSEELRISESTIERVLTYLENEHQIEQQKTNRDRLIIVTKWKSYQGSEQQNGQQMDNNRTTNGQQMDTNKNDKNDKNDKNEIKDTIVIKRQKMIKRKNAFIEEVDAYIADHPQCKPVRDDFVNWWTQPNKSGTKFAREGESFFDMGKRLGTFLKNNRKVKMDEPKNSGIHKENGYVPKF